VQITADVVKHIQEVHGRALSGLVCEFVQGFDSVVSLTAVMRAEWDPVPVPSRSNSETPYALSANASYEVRALSGLSIPHRRYSALCQLGTCARKSPGDVNVAVSL